MNQSPSYEEESAFGRSCAKLRKHMELTQRELAGLLGISAQAVGQWERGVRFPGVQQLASLLALALRRQALAPGQEYEQAQRLWLTAGHPQADFEDFWMQAQLAAASARTAVLGLLVLKRQAAASPAPDAGQAHPLTWPRFDWGDALTVPALYGREAERAELERWVIQERCQIVSVVGMGGIGKSTLSATFMRQVASAFEAVIFRSLRNGPSCQDLMTGCLLVLAPELLPGMPPGVEQRFDLLLERLQARRCLLVLDNLETLLAAHNQESRFRAGYENFALLLERLAHTPHQSCLLLTSRELPAALVRLERSEPVVRAMRLSGLEPAACERLMADREISGSTRDYERLAGRYDGNPLALNIVAESIRDLFGGRISSFLEQDTVVFSSIRDLLAEQWSRLPAFEQGLLFWLTIVREAVTSEELDTMLVPPVDRALIGEALQSLQRRSLVVEQSKTGRSDGEPGKYTLHSVVLEYVTELLVERVSEQILRFIAPTPQAGRESSVGAMAFKAEDRAWEDLLSYALAQSTARDNVRQAQERLIVSPVLLRLQASLRQNQAVEERLLRLLGELRGREQKEAGYGPANLLVLLRALRGHLRGLDLSSLAIRGAYLQGVEMQDATLAEASLLDSIFTDAFESITAIAISKSGRYWATGGRRGGVKVWRVEQVISPTLHLDLQAHTDYIYALAFSPDERLLASGSLDGSIRLWEVETGAALWSSWQMGIDCLTFAPGGSVLASGGHEGSVRLWDATSGRPMEDLPHPGPVFSLAWSPDGALLASGDASGTLRLWRIEQEEGGHPATCVEAFSGHGSWVRGLDFAPDGSLLASASWDGTVKLWERGEEDRLGERQTLRGHTDRVQSLAWSPDGRTLASGSFDCTIRLWDGRDGRALAVLPGQSGFVSGLSFTPDSRYLLSGSDDSTLRLWEVERGMPVRVMQGYSASLNDLDWSPDGTRLASVGADTTVSLWEVEGGQPPRVLRGHTWNVAGAAWRSDGRLLATSGWENTIRLWDTASGNCIQILRDLDHRDTIFFGVALSPDGTLLAGGTMLQGALVWNVATRSLRWTARTDAPRVLRLAWHPAGGLLAGGDEEGHVYLWQASSGRLALRLQGHQGAVGSVAFSPDGSLLASGGGRRGRGEIFVWDVSSGASLHAVPEHPAVVTTLSWTASGKVIVSGGSDGRLRWWDVQSGRCVREREAHQGNIQAIKVSPDSRTLASCGDDGAIQLWNLQDGEHVRTLRRDRPYEHLNITGIRGLTEAQKTTLRTLGAVEEA